MVVAGITYSSAPYNDDNAYIVKYNSSGSIQWITTVKGPYTAGGGMTVDPTTNNPVAAGYACPSISVSSATGPITATTAADKCSIYVIMLQGTPPPTTAPTRFPTFAPPPPELPIEPLQQGEQTFRLVVVWIQLGFGHCTTYVNPRIVAFKQTQPQASSAGPRSPSCAVASQGAVSCCKATRPRRATR